MSVANIVPIKKHVYTGPGVYGVTYKLFAATDLIVTLIFPSGATRLLVKEDEYTVALVDSGLNGANITVTTEDYSGGTEVLVSEAGDLVLQEDGTLVYEEGQVLESRAASYIVIAREVEFTQEIDWVNGSVLNMPLLTRSFDKTIMLLQQMNEVVKSGSITSNWRGTWVTGIPYYAKDITIGPSGNWYACHITHESGTFVDDLAAGYWVLVLDIVSISSIRDAAVLAKEAAIAARDTTLAAQAIAEAAAEDAETAISASKTVLSSDGSVTVTADATSINIGVAGYVVPYAENLVDLSRKPMLHLQEQVDYNTEGAALVADAWTRVGINTTIRSEIPGVLLDTAQKLFELPAGKYYINAKVMMYVAAASSVCVGFFVAGSIVHKGITEYHGAGGCIPSCSGILVLPAKAWVGISCYTGTAAAGSRIGVKNATGGITDVTFNSIYTDIQIFKLDTTIQN